MHGRDSKFLSKDRLNGNFALHLLECVALCSVEVKFSCHLPIWKSPCTRINFWIFLESCICSFINVWNHCDSWWIYLLSNRQQYRYQYLIAIHNWYNWLIWKTYICKYLKSQICIGRYEKSLSVIDYISPKWFNHFAFCICWRVNLSDCIISSENVGQVYCHDVNSLFRLGWYA